MTAVAVGLSLIPWALLFGASRLFEGLSAGTTSSLPGLAELLGAAVFVIGLWGLVTRYLEDPTGPVSRMAPAVVLVLAGSLPFLWGSSSAIALALLLAVIAFVRRGAGSAEAPSAGPQ